MAPRVIDPAPTCEAVSATLCEGHSVSRARQPSIGGADFCLEWDGSVDEIVALLKKNGIPAEAGPGPRTCARGVSTSVYFRDPDQNLVEFTVYDRPA